MPGAGSPAPADAEAVQTQAAANLRVAMSVLRRDDDLVTWLSDQLLAVAGTVPDSELTNGAFKLMREWADGPLAREYSLSSDWDDRWRTGGSVAEVIEEAPGRGAHPGGARTVRGRAR